MTTTTTGFDFGGQVAPDKEAYHPPLQEMLPKGNYRARIADLEDATSSGGFPLLKVRLEAAEGVAWDNIVISPNEFAMQKLLGFIDSSGAARPDPEKGEIDRETGRLSLAYGAKLANREVGVLVRDEEDNRPDHKGEMRPRVKGYQPVDRLEGNLGPQASTPSTSAPKASSALDEVPF